MAGGKFQLEFIQPVGKRGRARDEGLGHDGIVESDHSSPLGECVWDHELGSKQRSCKTKVAGKCIGRFGSCLIGIGRAPVRFAVPVKYVYIASESSVE